jgi:hypothetical protein
MKSLRLICLILSCYVTPLVAAPSNHYLPYYLEYQIGFNHVLHGTSHNDQVLYQRPNNTTAINLQSITENSQSNAVARLGIGKHWHITPAWSWSLGLEYSQFNLYRHGYAIFPTNIMYHYHYTTTVRRLGLLSKLYYQHHNWVYYGGLLFGFANLTSKAYNSDFVGTDHYPDNRTTQFAAGLRLGVQYQILSNLDVGMMLGCQYDGQSQLGARQASIFGSPTQGNIKQSNQYLTVGLLVLDYYF